MLLRQISILFLLVLVSSSYSQRRNPVQQIEKFSPVIIAHRGNSSKAPENTLTAFRQAVELKADFVELDYVHSQDGVPLVIHDKDLDRTTDAVKRWQKKKLLVKEVPLARLKELDAGSWFDKRFQGERLPTLDESLDVIQKGSITLIERKAGDAKTCVELLRKKKLIDSVIVQAFDWDFLADCHALEPRLVLIALGSKELTKAKIAEAKRLGVKGLGWNHKDLTEASVGAARAEGCWVWCYTVNDESRARDLVKMGVTGLITDVPGTLMPLRKPRK